MDDSKLQEVLLKLHISVAEVHAEIKYLREDLASHNKSSKETKEKVESLTRDVNFAKGVIAILGFLSGIGLLRYFFF